MGEPINLLQPQSHKAIFPITKNLLDIVKANKVFISIKLIVFVYGFSSVPIKIVSGLSRRTDFNSFIYLCSRHHCEWHKNKQINFSGSRSREKINVLLTQKGTHSDRQIIFFSCSASSHFYIFRENSSLSVSIFFPSKLQIVPVTSIYRHPSFDGDRKEMEFQWKGHFKS